MNKSIAVAFSCLLAAAAARADDMGKQDPLPMQPKMEQKDAMRKKPMQRDAMKHEAMKQDDAPTKPMAHDDMRKEMPAQPAATKN